jgi:hypothetical protein
MDDMDVNIEDLAIDEVRELLLDAGADISLEQAEQLARFITQSGSIADALDALTQLSEQRDAA